MGRLINDIMQKINPASKKMIRIRFKRKTGRWLEFDIPPSKKRFVMKWNKDKSYQLVGEPDIEDFTNQRMYVFHEDHSYPININTNHPDLIKSGKEAENIELLLAGESEASFQKAMLLKNKKEINFMMWAALIAGLNLIVCIIGFYMLFNKLGVTFS